MRRGRTETVTRYRPPRRTVLATLGAAGTVGCLADSPRATTALPVGSDGTPTDGWRLVVDEQWEYGEATVGSPSPVEPEPAQIQAPDPE